MYNEKLEQALVKYEKQEKFKLLGEGTKSVLRFYYKSRSEDNLSKALIIDEVVWESDFESFSNALKKYNINEVVFGCTYSNTLSLLMYLLENGFQVEGTVVYSKRKIEVLMDELEIKKGIKLVRK